MWIKSTSGLTPFLKFQTSYDHLRHSFVNKEKVFSKTELFKENILFYEV